MIVLYTFPSQTTWESEALLHGLRTDPGTYTVDITEYVLDANGNATYEVIGSETHTTAPTYRNGVAIAGLVIDTPGTYDSDGTELVAPTYRPGWYICLNLLDLERQGFTELPVNWDPYLSYDFEPALTYAGFEGPIPPAVA